MSDEEKLWTVRVYVTRVFTMNYVVDAETQEEAAEKAESGETVSEDEIREEGVQDRVLLDGLPVPYERVIIKKED